MLYADIETAVRALNNALLSATSKLRGWIAFSGGVDSSIIAAMCPSLPLISFAVEGSKDASWVLEAGELLGRDIELVEVGIDEVEHHLRDVVALLHTTNPLDVVLATPLYIMGKHIVNKGEETVKNKDLRREIISGQGADELFGGYNKYEKMDEVLLSSVMRDDLEEVMKKSTQRDSLTLLSLGFTLNTPFLNPSVIEVAQNIPLSLKLYRPNRQGELQEKVGSNPSPATGGGEIIRKYVLRRVALEYLPKELAYHPKQALQYSTGLIKAMHRLASKEGIARKQPARLRAYLDIF